MMRVALFVPCFIDQFAPQIALGAARLLRHLGHEVIVPSGQTCCGQPTFNTGYAAETREIARHFLRLFRDFDTIVAPSGSCVAMIRENYSWLMQGTADAAEAEALGQRVFEFTQFLVDRLGVTDVGARFAGCVTMHDSCHAARHLGVREQPRALLRAVQGLRLVEMEEADLCCGFGGAFSVRYPELSTAMADEKLARAQATGAAYIVGVEASCLMHLQGRLARRGWPLQTIHIAELLARGCGLL